MINFINVKLLFFLTTFGLISCGPNIIQCSIQNDKIKGVVFFIDYGRRISKSLLTIGINDTAYFLVGSDIEERQIKVDKTEEILINNIAVGDSIYKLANNDTLLVFKKNTNKVIKIIMFK